MIYTRDIPSPIGLLTAASDGTAITGLWIENQKFWGDTLPASTEDGTHLPVLSQLENWLKAYFRGISVSSEAIPVKMSGTAFQNAVWKKLMQIPYGTTVTYGQIAAELANERSRAVSSQAVGNAVGKNPISILVPCHRVVGAKGALTGYAGGIERKEYLLELEGSLK